MEKPFPAGKFREAGAGAAKPPFPLVIPPRSPAYALLGSLLAGLLLWGCATDDGPEYDIPMGERVLSAQLETEADGTPVILAEVGMYYGTHAKLEEWESKYSIANAQSILFSKRNGTWTSHPFRNLQYAYGSRSILARNAYGSVQPLIWDRRKLTLYGRAGEDWVPRSIVRLQDDALYYSMLSAAGLGLALSGDSAWQAMVFAYDDKRVRLERSDGTSLTLDSGVHFQPTAYHSGRDFNMVVGSRSFPGNPDSGRSLAAYRWSLDPEHPNLQRQILTDFPNIFRAYFASAEGEERLYGRLPDSLIVFALRGGELVHLRSQAMETPGLGPGMNGPSRFYELYPDPQGCMQGFAQAVSDSAYKSPPSTPLILHVSSCREGIDTLPLPAEVENIPGFPMLSTPRYTADGRPMVLMTVLKTNGFPKDGDVGEPAWIYLATMSPAGRWEWELIARY